MFYLVEWTKNNEELFVLVVEADTEPEAMERAYEETQADPRDKLEIVERDLWTVFKFPYPPKI